MKASVESLTAPVYAPKSLRHIDADNMLFAGCTVFKSYGSPVPPVDMSF